MKERIFKVLKNKKYVDSKCKSLDKSLWEYLNSNFLKNDCRTRHELAFLLYHEKTVKNFICPNCKNNVILFDTRKWKYKLCCSRTCSNKFKVNIALEKNPNHYKDIAKKSVKTKSNTKINGKNIHQISALKSAKKIDYNNVVLKTKITKEQNNIKKAQSIKNRIIKCVNHFGLEKFSVLFIKLIEPNVIKFNKTKFRIAFNRLKRCLGTDLFNELINNYKYNFTEFYVCCVLKKRLLYNCPVCGNITSEYYQLLEDNIYDRKIYNTCSRSCGLIKGYEIGDRSKEYKKPKDIEKFKKNMSTAMINRWKKYTKAEIKEIRMKAVDTMLNDMDENGIDMIQRKKQKALQTRIKNGTAVNRQDRYINKDYMKYRNKVNRITKQQPLENLDNFNYRGRHTHHLDHIFPISKGYIYNIPAELIGDISNLRFIEACINQSKSANIDENIISSKIKHFLEENNIDVKD